MSKFYVKFDDFSNDLYKELSWRKHELSILNSSIPDKSSKKQQVFLRMAIPILYAHWEGFINNSASYYLCYVNSNRLKHSELTTQFFTLSLKNKLHLNEAKNLETQTKIVDYVLNNFEKRSNVPTKNIIKTKSNLNFKVFNEILYVIGFDESMFKNFESLINDLIDLRNFIAHGENKIVNKETYNNFYTEIINLMDYFKTELENFSILKKFKK